MLHQALSDLCAELLHGPPEGIAWMLNPGDDGLLRGLDRLTPDEASSPAPSGGAPIAAHVDHLRYGFQLLTRWSRGENPFVDADYSASWQITRVTEEEWAELRRELGSEAEQWRRVMNTPRDLDEMELKGMISSVAHLAYHVSAIRQIHRALQGRPAKD